jgi:hypothetical protein
MPISPIRLASFLTSKEKRAFLDRKVVRVLGCLADTIKNELLGEKEIRKN